MKLRGKFPLWVFLCATSSNATAVLAISGSVVIDPYPSTLMRGQSATITYTITNTGDEPLDSAAIGTGYYAWGPRSTIFPLATIATSPCLVRYDDLSPRPGEPAIVLNAVFFRPIPLLPGETRQCVMEISVSEETAGPFVQQFGFTGARGAQSTNVSQSVFFSLGLTTAVPALSPLGLGTLMLGVLAITAMLSRRQLRANAEQCPAFDHLDRC